MLVNHKRFYILKYIIPKIILQEIVSTEQHGRTGKEKYLFDTTDCVHFTHVTSSSHKLDANMGALIDDLIPIV